MLGCLQSNLFYEVLAYWLLVSGVIGFLAMGVDKARARGGEWRIPEATLLVISLVGGALGAAIGAVMFHHKTSKPSFLVLFLPVVVLWLLALQWAGFLGRLGTYLPQ
ncbi:MAG: DUF1294 domain-containing protein [Nitrososphaerota archaeon]|nr:DUF1294 domain-containing protein [Nitrososphaerota archaeon]MDG6911667.1 DUF1294 domain-containing protein [Nitrososphaerota archaeon]MDG6940569.1 DUF1294 domain-containing protein [Nitrososphaerota archaeon]MDG6960880.1 DUF1294 domain-containing protein [Nitrososphaerota archaeon]MDG6963247.1 DUF1294 domain-containing protein [Nitrososphaerota archaeon]